MRRWWLSLSLWMSLRLSSNLRILLDLCVFIRRLSGFCALLGRARVDGLKHMGNAWALFVFREPNASNARGVLENEERVALLELKLLVYWRYLCRNRYTIRTYRSGVVHRNALSTLSLLTKFLGFNRLITITRCHGRLDRSTTKSVPSISSRSQL